MPLHQVFHSLVTLATLNQRPEGLPDPSAILPYIGLYTIVQLKPFEMQDTILSTTFFPPPSVLRKGLWEIAPNQTVSTAPKKVAHIFDSLAVNDASGQHPSLGIIPLQPEQPEYPHKRYWRLRYTTLDWILSAVILRSFLLSTRPTTDELKIVKLMYAILSVNHNRPSGGTRPSGDAGDAGPSGEAEPSEAASSGNAGGAEPSGEGHGEDEGSEGERKATRGRTLRTRKGKGRRGT
ncbi:hypothetical protein BGY98DRAFT_945758 [Russula aff. rugulosa BPL654]|nr:hypothetical protein BGY98DRAFT_945758 [Russula aff. rugulosa BPL654]